MIREGEIGGEGGGGGGGDGGERVGGEGGRGAISVSLTSSSVDELRRVFLKSLKRQL